MVLAAFSKRKAMSSKKKKTRQINGPFYPWLVEMGNSEAMRRLRKNSEAINVLTMFMTKFTANNGGVNLCVTYKEAAPFISAATFAKAKLWLCAFGFLYCRQYGRLERKRSIYDLIPKWRHLSSQAEKLDRIECLLNRHDRVRRIPIKKIKSKQKSRERISPRARKHAVLWVLEQKIFEQ